MLIGIDGNEANIERRVGSNQYAFELLWALYGLENLNQWVVYLREKPLGDMPPVREGWVYRVFGPRKFWTQWRLPLDLYTHHPRPDIFFTPGHYAPRWSPVPRVISIMDLGYLKFPDQFTKKDFYQLRSWTEYSLKVAKRIFAISESTKNDIIRTYGVLRDRITVTYPGYDKNKFQISNFKFQIERVREKYKIASSYILFLGTLKPSKNIKGLLEAYRIWRTTYNKGGESLRLVIAGKKGWMYEEIFEKVRSLGLEKQVVFTDFVPEEDVSGLLAGAQVFVMPSFWEGFGIPVVEAMACGIPVVASSVASLPEIIGNAGILVDPNKPEEIAEGINKALLRKSDLRLKGLKRVENFSWEKCARQTLEVLENIR